MISDNGSQFISEQTQKFACSKGITWKFNLTPAHWCGGIYERLVRSTKRCLKKMLFRSYLTYEEVQTVLSEIQLIINNRPLTLLSEEPGQITLTPNHMLFGRRLELESGDQCKLPMDSNLF